MSYTISYYNVHCGVINDHVMVVVVPPPLEFDSKNMRRLWWRRHCDFQMSSSYGEITPSVVQHIMKLKDMLFLHNNL